MSESPSSQPEPGEAAAAAYSEEYLRAPGVRFAPTDQELIIHYLRRKLRGQQPPTNLVHVADVYEEHPKDLTARLGESVEDFWYVFSKRNRKYANGKRPSRSTADTGRWKTVGKNEVVTLGTAIDAADGVEKKVVIGTKSALAYELFLRNGDSKKKLVAKTDWKMTEFVDVDSNKPISSAPNFMLLNSWVLCKITRKAPKKAEGKQIAAGPSQVAEVEEEEEEDVEPAMLVDEQLLDTTPDQARAMVPYLAHDGADGSSDGTEGQMEEPGADLLQPDVDGDQFEWADDLGPLVSGGGAGNSFDDTFDQSGTTSFEWNAPNSFEWNHQFDQASTDTDSIGSKLQVPADPDPILTPLELPDDPQHWHVVPDLLSSDDGVEPNKVNNGVEPTKVNNVVEPTKANNGDMAVNNSPGSAKTGGQK